jgi:hypothetical protein
MGMGCISPCDSWEVFHSWKTDPDGISDLMPLVSQTGPQRSRTLSESFSGASGVRLAASAVGWRGRLSIFHTWKEWNCIHDVMPPLHEPKEPIGVNIRCYHETQWCMPLRATVWLHVRGVGGPQETHKPHGDVGGAGSMGMEPHELVE